MAFWTEFKEFAVKGNVADMAVAFLLGVAFSAVVTSFSTDILGPPIGLVLGERDLSDMHVVLRAGDPAGPYPGPEAAAAAGAVTLDYGQFLMTTFSFLVTAVVLFLVVRGMNRLRRREEAATAPSVPSRKTCPWCASGIPAAAKRCPECTSELAT